MKLVAVCILILAFSDPSFAQSQSCDSLPADLDTAERTLLDCISSQPDNPKTFLALAQFYALDAYRDRGKSRKYIDKALDKSDNAVYVLEEKLALARRGVHRPMPPFMVRMQRQDLAKKILSLGTESAIAYEELGLNEMSKYLVTRNRLKFDVSNRRGSQMGTVDREVFSPERLNLDLIEQQLGPLVTLDNQARKSYAIAVDFFRRSLKSNSRQFEVYKKLLEIYFLEKDFQSALATVTSMQEEYPGSPRTWFLAAAIMHRLDNSDVAEGMIVQGKSLLLDVEKHAYENISDLLTESEQVKYDIQGQVYADRFWSERDPVLSSSVNERKVEHIVRIVIADLLYDEGNGKLGRFSERGQTYIRYGDPLRDSTIDGIVYRGDSPGILNNSGTTIQMWNYGRFTLAFERIDFSDEYRLYSPSATAFNSYFDYSDALQGDYVLAAREESRKNPELYFYKSEAIPIPFEWRQSSFRGLNGAEDRIVAYSIPVDSSWQYSSQKIDVSSNLFSWTNKSRTWTKLGFASRLYDSTESSDADWSGYFNYIFDGQEESLALELFANGGDASGIKRFSNSKRTFNSGDLVLSDILLASVVEEDEEDLEGDWRRGNLSIVPWGAVSVDKTFKPYIYFEVYNLGIGDYEIEVSFRKKRKNRKGIAKVLNLFQGKGQSVAASFTVASTESTDRQYLQLDLPQSQGQYSVWVTATQAGMVVESSLDLTIR